MIALALAVVALVLAGIPALLFRANLRAYCPPPAAPSPGKDGTVPALSVLIPARNEENTIGAAVQAVLASRGVEFEVLVLDDHILLGELDPSLVSTRTTYPRLQVVLRSRIFVSWPLQVT